MPKYYKFEVIVGEVGIVHQSEDEILARAAFEAYCTKSREKLGRASGERITLMQDGEPIHSYQPEEVCEHRPRATSISVVTDEPHKPRVEEVGFPRLVFVCDVVCEKCGLSGSFPSHVDLIDINW